LSYDAPSGLYLAGSVSSLIARSGSPELLGAQQNIGYAVRLKSGPTVDLGIVNSTYGSYFSGRYIADYTELYAGVIGRRMAAHIRYSPNYFRADVHTVYAEVDGTKPVTPGAHLNAHFGVLHQFAGRDFFGRRRTYYDWRVSGTTGVGPFELQLALSGGGPGSDYYDSRPHSRQAVTVGLTFSF
jgi:uncharacterized protein (TIGR02001 family)